MDKLTRTKVWPLSFTLPWGFWLGVPPPFLPMPTRILIEVLAPITFERTGRAAADDDVWVRVCADRVEERMQQALTRLACEL